MLVIALIAAVCLYVGLYWIYLAAQSHVAGATSILATLNQILLTPQNDVFILLRGLILATFLYVIGDMLLSPARKGLKNRRLRRLEAQREALAFKGSPAPRPPKEDDDFLDYAH